MHKINDDTHKFKLCLILTYALSPVDIIPRMVLREAGVKITTYTRRKCYKPIFKRWKHQGCVLRTANMQEQKLKYD
jgi:hypothetical protein